MYFIHALLIYLFQIKTRNIFENKDLFSFVNSIIELYKSSNNNAYHTIHVQINLRLIVIVCNNQSIRLVIIS